MVGQKKLALVLAMGAMATACGRDISSGIVQVDVQISAELLAVFQQAAAAAGEPTETVQLDAQVYLVDNRLPIEQLTRVAPRWQGQAVDVDNRTIFNRTEGIYTVVVDADGNGSVDAFLRDVYNNSAVTVVVSGINPRGDGGFLAVNLEKLAYEPGETLRYTVSGYLPVTESVNVEIWNARNGGFSFWLSATAEVFGVADFSGELAIPLEWPPTDSESGSEYLVRARTAVDIFPGTPFVLLPSSDPNVIPGGPPPANPFVEVADGQNYVNNRQVAVSFGAENAAYFKLANDLDGLGAASWTGMDTPNLQVVAWLLAEGLDGPRVVYAQFANRLGTVSAVTSDSVILDSTPPLISNITVAPTIATAGTVLTVQFSVNEALARAEIVFGGTTYTNVNCVSLNCSWTHNVLGTEPEGIREIEIVAVNLAALETRVIRTVEFDFTPPDTFFAAPPATGRVADIYFVFELVASEPSATFQCRLDAAAFAPCAASVLVTVLAEGAHVFQARAVDPGGNVDPTPVVANWIVDTLPPTTAILGQSAPLTNSSIVWVDFSANEPATFECFLENFGAGFVACSSRAFFGGLNQGIHTLHIRAIDLAGNVEPVSATVQWAVDLTPPVISPLTIVPFHARAGITVEIVFTVGEISGFEPVVTVVDGFAHFVTLVGNTYTYHYDVTGGEPEGLQAVVVRYRDAAGNFSQRSGDVNLDFTPPQTFFAGPLPFPITTVADTTFPLVSDDPFAIFECDLDGVGFSPCPSTVFYPALTDAVHTFQARAIDRAGNVDPTPVSYTWRIDTTPPWTTIVTAPQSPTRSSLARFEFFADEPATFMCQVPQILPDFVHCNSPAIFGGLDEGDYEFLVFAIDTAGNVELFPKSASWTVDFTPPALSNVTVDKTYVRAGVTVAIEFDVGEPLPVTPTVTIGAIPVTAFSLAGSHYTFTYTALGSEDEAPHDVSVLIRDAAFNTNSLALVDGIVFDFTPPDTFGGNYPALSRGEVYSVQITSNEPLDPGGAIEYSFDVIDPFLPCLAAPCTPFVVFGTTIVGYYDVGPFVVDGEYTLRFRAVDRAGNIDLTPVIVAVTVDTTPPPPPNAAFLQVTVNDSPAEDELSGLPGAVTWPDTARLIVYGIAGVFVTDTTMIDGFEVFPDGSFTTIPIGDNLSDHDDLMCVVALDAIGNASDCTPFLNPKTEPQVIAALIFVTVSNFIGSPDYANAGDQIVVMWDNSATGNNLSNVTRARARIFDLGFGPVDMINDGNGRYFATFPVTSSPAIDSQFFYAEVNALNETAGTESGWVFALMAVAVDNVPPAAPSNVTAWTDGVYLYGSWTDSASLDVTWHASYHDVVPNVTSDSDDMWDSPPWVTAEVVPCTDEYFGVQARDAAENESPMVVSGPIPIIVPVPTLQAWGTIAGGFAFAKSPNSNVTSVEFYFDLDAGQPYEGATTTGTPSPVTRPMGFASRLTPLELGLDYFMASRGLVDTCRSEFSNEVSFRTLNFVGVGGSISQGGVCEGDCADVGVEGQSFIGGLGMAVANVGDIYGGDATDDIIVGAPGNQKVVLMSGQNLTQVTAVEPYQIGFDIFGGGPSLASGVDLNGDGVTDYVVGSPLETASGIVLAGVVRAFDGATHAMLWSQHGSTPFAQLGYAVALLNVPGGPGRVVAGAFGCANASCVGTNGQYSSAGSAVVLAGPDGSLVQTHAGTVMGGFFGVSIAAGDLDQDGWDDYVIGAPGPMVASAVPGRVHVFSGQFNSQIGAPFVLPLETHRFGASVAIVQPYSAATTRYVAVGAPSIQFAPGFVVLIGDDTTVVLPPGDAVLTTFGSAMRGIRDMNGDGRGQLVVGAPNVPFGFAFGGGNAFVYRATDAHLLYQVSGGSFDGAIGYAFTDIADRNGDGNAELVIGAPGSIGDGFFGAGRVYLLTTKPPEP